MKKLIKFLLGTILMLVLTLSVQAQQVSGTQITSSIVPNDLQDDYPTHEDIYGKGGYRVVVDIAERDAIKESRKIFGMLVYVQSDNIIYRLDGLPNVWTEFASGESSSPWNIINGGILYDNNVTVKDTLKLNGNINQNLNHNITNNIDSYTINQLDTFRLIEDVTSTTSIGNHINISVLEDSPFDGTGIRYHPFWSNTNNYKDINTYSPFGFQPENTNADIDGWWHTLKMTGINTADNDSVYVDNWVGYFGNQMNKVLNDGIIYVPEITLGKFQHTGAGVGKFYSDSIIGLDVAIKTDVTEKYVEAMVGLNLTKNFDALNNTIGINERMYGKNYFSSETTVDNNLIITGNIIAPGLTLGTDEDYSSGYYQWLSTTTMYEAFKDLSDKEYLNSFILSVDSTIYINPTGSDVTGDGSLSNPYATTKYVLDLLPSKVNSTVTLSLSSGTFADDMVDWDLNKFTGSGNIIIDGTMTEVVSNVVLSAPYTNNLFGYDVTVDGNPPTWTPDEWKGYFLNNNKYYAYGYYSPISSNGVDSIEYTYTTNEDRVTGIYEASSILTCSADMQYKSLQNLFKLDFQELTINGGSGVDISFTGYTISFKSTKIDAKTIAAPYSDANFHNSTISGGVQFVLTTRSNSGYSIFNTGLYYLSGLITGANSKYNNAIVNIASSSTKRGIDMTKDVTIASVSGFNVKFKGNGGGGSAFRIGGGTFSISPSYPINVYLENVDNLVTISQYSNTNFILNKSNIYGNPLVDWFTLPAIKDITAQSFIYIEGFHYLDFDKSKSSTLTNNTTTEITIGDKTDNRSIDLEYTAVRNGKIEQGNIMIFHDGTTLYINKSSHDNQSGLGIGLNISTKFDITNTDLINLELILDDNVDDCKFNYSITRKMI